MRWIKSLVYRSVSGSALALLVGAQPKPFAQTDWPNPQQPRGIYASIESLACNTSTVAPYPNNQYDWPVPKAPGRLAVGFEQKALTFATFVNVQPVGNQLHVLPPRGPTRNPDFIGSCNPSLISTLAALPQNNNYDWPNPRGPQTRVNYWVGGRNPILPPQPIPVGSQYDWPNPRGAKGVDGFVQPALTFATFVNTPPVGQQLHILPPRGPAPLNLGYTQSSVQPYITFVNVQPFTQTDWPNPIPPRVGAGFTQGALTFRTFVNVQPTAQRLYDLPPRRPASLYAGISTLALEFVTGTPFSQDDWPNPTLPKRQELGFVQQGLFFRTFVNVKPVGKQAFELPPRAPQPLVKDYIQPTWANFIVAPVIPPIPPQPPVITKPMTARGNVRGGFGRVSVRAGRGRIKPQQDP